MNRNFSKILAAFIILLIALPVAAEGVDEEALVYAIWMWAIIGTVFGFVLVHINRLVGLIAQVIFIFLVYAPVSEWHDLHVGPVIAHEAGKRCALHEYGAMSMLLVACLSSWIILYFRKRKPAELQKE
jgi:hypothetical protein